MKQLKTPKNTTEQRALEPHYRTDQYESVYKLDASGRDWMHVGKLNGRTLREWKKARAQISEIAFYEAALRAGRDV